MKQALEIVRFRVTAGDARKFVDGRSAADKALETFDGFLGSELSRGDGDTWHLSVRWASFAAARAAQGVTLASPGLAPLNAWLALAEVLAFETVEVQRAGSSAVATGTDGATGTTQLPATNIGIARRFATQGLGKGDVTIFDELIDPDVVVTTGLSPKEPIRGRDAYKNVIAGFADAWPVDTFVVEDCFAAGDQVVVRFTATAVFEKDYYGITATRAVVPLKEIHVYTIRQGRIVEVIVGAINLPYEFIMYPVLKDLVLGDLASAP